MKSTHSVAKIQQKTFPNGLRVIVYPTTFKHIFHFELILKAGALQQNPKNIGYAHFLEHLMSFYPSEKYPNSLHNQDCINELGIDMNAWTDDSNCGYYMSGLSEYKEIMLDLLFSALHKPVWKSSDPVHVQDTKNIFEQERGAVIRELSNYINDPWYNLQTCINKTLYRGTNLDVSIKSELDNVKNPKKLNIKTFQEFYNTFYKPENMVLSIVTDKSPKSVFSDLEKNFKDYLNDSSQIVQNSNHTIIMPVPKPLNRNSVYFKKTNSSGEYKINFIVRLPFTYFDLNEAIILDMISTILTGGLSNRLYKVLRSEMGAVYNVSSELNLDFRCSNYSHFEIETITEKSKVKDVINAIKTNINNFKSPTSEEYKQIRNQINREYYNMEQMRTFKKTFDEFNEYDIWGKIPRKTTKQFYDLQMNILDSDKTQKNINLFVDRFLKNKYYIFYSGKSKISGITI